MGNGKNGKAVASKGPLVLLSGHGIDPRSRSQAAPGGTTLVPVWPLSQSCKDWLQTLKPLELPVKHLALRFGHMRESTLPVSSCSLAEDSSGRPATLLQFDALRLCLNFKARLESPECFPSHPKENRL